MSQTKNHIVLSSVKWAKFRLEELFSIKKGKRLTKAEMSTGMTPFVGAIDSNNGVSGRIGQPATHEGGTLTVSYNGSVAEAFYQPNPFWASDDVNVLYPIFHMSPHVALFLCTIIRMEKYRFNYGRKWNLERMKISTIFLPVDENGTPDWKFMDDYIRSLSFGAAIADKGQFGEAINPKSSSEKIIKLDVTGWANFKLEQLFLIKKGKRLTKADMSKGQTPYIGAIESNNGVSAQIGQTPTHQAGTITVSYNGSVAEAFYQPQPFWATDDVNVLYPNFEMSPYVALFLCSVIRMEKFRFNYGRKWGLERMKASVIKLPVDSSGKPDWDFMERYIRSLPFSASIVEKQPKPVPGIIAYTRQEAMKVNPDAVIKREAKLAQIFGASKTKSENTGLS